MRKRWGRTLSSLRYIFNDIYKWNKSLLVVMAVYTAAKAISPFIWIYVPKLLIDEVTGEQGMDVVLTILGVTFVLASVVYFLVEYCNGAFRMKMNDVRYRYIHLLGRTTLTMDFPLTEDSDTLDKVKTAQRTVSSPWRGIGGTIRSCFNLFGSLIGMIGFIAIIASFNVWVLLFLIVTIILSYYITDKVNHYERDRRDDLSYYERKSFYASNTMADFKFGKDLRIYGLKELMLKKKKESDKEMIGVVSDIQWYNFKGYLLESLLFLLREGTVYGFLIYSVVNLNMSIGDFVMYSVAVSSFATWLQELLKELAFVNVQSEYIADYIQFIDEKSMTDDSNKLEVPDVWDMEIEFDHVSFKYPNSERYIFKDFSMVINKGETIAIVGVNGAGKTTLVKLLTGLYEPSEGEIRVNGVNIHAYKKKDYWKLFSVVYQDVHVYPFNVNENITFEEAADENRLREAIENAGLKDKLDSLEKGYETPMLKVIDEEGIELSGGENQKLATARALYKQGRILIMDEPTSALDPIAENRLYQRFNQMIDGRTAIYISHRLSSTGFCDHIAFIEDGKLMEWGSHDELIVKDGAYAKLFNMQASYYREETAYE